MKAERSRHGGPIGFKENAVRIHRLRGVLKRMSRKVFPIFHNRLVFENLIANDEDLDVSQEEYEIAHLPDVLFRT